MLGSPKRTRLHKGPISKKHFPQNRWQTIAGYSPLTHMVCPLYYHPQQARGEDDEQQNSERFLGFASF